MKILYYASSSFGGLSNYAQEQAAELSKRGLDVTVLCSPYFEKRVGDPYKILPLLYEFRWKKKITNRFVRRVIGTVLILWNYHVLKREIVSGCYKRVLSVAYAEYLAPLWYRPFLKLARNGVQFSSVIQEPVRDFVVGPLWWHKWSVSCAYSFLKNAFVHDSVVLNAFRPMPKLRTVVIPYGPHQFPEPTESRTHIRERLGVSEQAVILLSFGHIRDNTNLQYAIEALREIPQAHLVVAGARISSSQKPESYYIELAKSLGVANRCTWIIDYISETEAANLFNASDLVLLTYSSSFRSASGVLHLAARYRKHSLVSAGQGSLQSVLRKYNIGIWVDPDNQVAVTEGIKDWIAAPPNPNWEAYSRDNSWAKNAELVSEAMELK